MRILVCGDRNWTDFEKMCDCMDDVLSIFMPVILIHGDARGADRMSEEALKQLYIDYYGSTEGIEVEKYPAQWDKHGRAAGPIRNQQMLDEGKPDLVLAFHSDIGNSKGTLDMIKRANKAGIEVRLYS